MSLEFFANPFDQVGLRQFDLAEVECGTAAPAYIRLPGQDERDDDTRRRVGLIAVAALTDYLVATEVDHMVERSIVLFRPSLLPVWHEGTHQHGFDPWTATHPYVPHLGGLTGMSRKSGSPEWLS